MIFGSFFHVDENAIFAFFWRRRRRKSGFGGGFETISLREIPPKIVNPHVFLGKIPGILGNSRKISKIPENSPKSTENPGNSRKSSGGSGKISTNRPIPLPRACPKVDFPLISLIPLEPHWFFRGRHCNSRDPEISHKMGSVGHGAESIFPPKGWGKLRNGLHPGLDEKIS